MRDTPFRLLFTLLGIAAAALYVAFQARNLIVGPILTITQPAHAATVLEGASLTVAGTARNTVALTLNGRPIFISPEGTFREDLALPLGYTVLTVEAQDRFGRTRIRTLDVWRTR